MEDFPINLIIPCGFFLILAWVGLRYGQRAAHAPALVCLVASYQAAFPWLQQRIEAGWLEQSTAEQEPASVFGLAGLFVLLAVVAEIIVRLGRRSHAAYYAMASMVVGLDGLLLVTFPGGSMPDAADAAILYGLIGVGLLAQNGRWRQPLVTSVGLALLTGAILWVLRGGFAGQLAAWGSVLAAEALLFGTLAVLLGYRRPNSKVAEHWDDGEGWEAWLGRGEMGNSTQPPKQTVPVKVYLAEPLARAAESVCVLAIVAAVWSGLANGSWGLAQAAMGCMVIVLVILFAWARAPVFLAKVPSFQGLDR